MNEASSMKRAAFEWVFGVFVLGLALGGVGGSGLTPHFLASRGGSGRAGEGSRSGSARGA
jgi:hypothetical protein